MPVMIAASEVPGLIKPGMTVFVQGSTGQPLALMRALADRHRELGGIDFVSVLTPGLNCFELGETQPPCRLTTFFDYRDLRRSWAAGPIRFAPLHYSEISAFLRTGPVIDLALIQLAPPDAYGHCSTGLAADFVPDILPACRTVIAEFNSAMPAMPNGPTVAIGDIDLAVEICHDLPISPMSSSDPVADRIARHAAALVNDGDTIQFGVGRLPQLVVARLADHNDLGLHNGLTSAAIRPLVSSGAMTGARKSYDRGLHVTGAVCGDADFYDWVARQDTFAMRPVSYTHAASTLARIDNLVAINSVIEIDLFGQANAEMAAGRQLSGSGGLVDFVRGARLSHGGRAIVCLPATSDGGRRSNIVPLLGSVVTIARTDIDHVVTEYGHVALRHLSAKARAEALVELAAPEFRDWLLDGARSTC